MEPTNGEKTLNAQRKRKSEPKMHANKFQTIFNPDLQKTIMANQYISLSN